MVLERKLKVLQMLPALEGGGVERGVVELNQFLVTEGHESLVISAGGRLVETIEKDGGTHIAWGIGKKSPWTLRYVYRLQRFLREEGIDLLHLRSRVPAWVGYLAWRGMPMNERPRLVTTVHGFYSVNGWSNVMTRGERVIAVSEAVREYVEMNYPKVDPKIVEVIHRGIDPSRYHPGFTPSEQWKNEWLEEFPGCRDKSVLVLPGRLSRLKGHGDFLRIIRDLKSRGLPIHGFIVGGVTQGKESYAKEISTLQEELGLSDDVTMTGYREDMRKVLSFAHLSFSLSLQPESFGRTVCEALSLGHPVIGYDQGGVGEQLRAMFPKGQVIPGDWCSAANLAEKFLSAPPPVKSNETFLLGNMLRQTLALYQHLVGESVDFKIH